MDLTRHGDCDVMNKRHTVDDLINKFARKEVANQVLGLLHVQYCAIKYKDST